MKLISIISLILSTSVFANLHFSPTSFNIKAKKVIFSDFETVETIATYDLSNKTAKARSIIKFNTTSDGFVAFDLRPEATLAKIDGHKIDILTIEAPGKATTYKLINTKLPAGNHELIIENEFDTNIKFSSDSVRSAFWMSDLTDRKYIEQYLPTNLEFDQYKQTLDIKIINAKSIEKHEIFTNGTLSVVSDNHFRIEYPEYFTSSSFYFHITKEDHFKKVKFTFTSKNGNKIPVIIYSRNRFSLGSAQRRTVETLNELETKIGPWSHPTLTIYIAGMGGMEHSGATITSMSALGHEITHSFYARGVMPADGNSGWMDEAIASWRDKGYKSVSSPNFSTTQMSGHSEYKRTTDRKAYTQGANFMAYLNHRLLDQGGLISFLSKFHKQYDHQSVTTKMFKKELELYSGEDYSAEFNQYIFGSVMSQNEKIGQVEENPYHPKLTREQLEDLL